MELCPAEVRCIKNLPWGRGVVGEGRGGLERIVGLFVIGFQVFVKKIIHQIIALVTTLRPLSC